MLRIDLNADVGEECGDDASLLRVVTTANVAAGGHAGGGDVLLGTVRTAAGLGVAVGAHPSYPDKESFGRVSRAESMGRQQLIASLADQVALVRAACIAHGTQLRHVKAHGALYNDAMARDEIAEVLVEVARETGAPALMGLPGSVMQRVCAEHGVTFIAEGYADRSYEPDGALTPRSQAGAVIADPAVVVARVLQMVTHGSVIARDGGVVGLPVQTICLHGDTPGATALAVAVRQALEAQGVLVRAVAGS